MILEESKFIVYMRKMQYTSYNGLISFNYYFKYDGECLRRISYAKRHTGNYFIGIGTLNNYFKPMYMTEDVMIALYINVDVQGVTSYITELFAKETSVSQEVFDMYMDYTRQVGIPEENLIDIIKTVSHAIQMSMYECIRSTT
ncbi:PREDICTED: odorant-binding protein-like [Chrysochloris asiatica]|uniref:Odorant-binding protein-like n=1 Tax=Chrysochloris asiatica TaxID=185453 RepID=A0A9B0T302_CHRAS|nr:PREDICTED: odorant-binding protein-like [Chrysochloris asiatica]